MGTLYIHPGMHKTGTSTFQNACAEQRDELKSAGFFYYRDRYEDVSHNHFRPMITGGKSDELFAAMRESFDAGSVNLDCIISGEDIAYLQTGHLLQVLDVCRGYFDKIKMVAVIRPPISYMHSAAQQILKEPRATVVSLFNRIDVSPWYQFRFEKFISQLGRENCIFLPFSRNSVHELAAVIGVPVEVGGRSDNQSMSFWVAKNLNALKPFETFSEINPVIVRLREADPGDGRRFEAPVELIDHWRHQIDADIAWMRSVWGAPSGFYDEVMPTTQMVDFEVLA